MPTALMELVKKEIRLKTQLKYLDNFKSILFFQKTKISFISFQFYLLEPVNTKIDLFNDTSASDCRFLYFFKLN